MELPKRNRTVHFYTAQGERHTGWHSGTRWHSYQKPYTKPDQPDWTVIKWEELSEEEARDCIWR